MHFSFSSLAYNSRLINFFPNFFHKVLLLNSETIFYLKKKDFLFLFFFFEKCINTTI